MSEAKPTYTFAGIPGRAIGDQRLTALHFRLLAAIAVHDQMSARTQGQGCWASLRTLAGDCGCHYNSLSPVLHELGGWGYVAIDRQEKDRRRHVLRVIYTGEDALALKRPEKVRPQPNEIVRPQAGNPEIVSPPNEQPTVSIEEPVRNIFRSDIPQKRFERYSAEAGPRQQDRNPAGVLAQIQRRLKRHEPIPEIELQGMRESVETIIESAEGGSQTLGWAESTLLALEDRAA